MELPEERYPLRAAERPSFTSPAYRPLAFLILALCLFELVDGLIPQLQMSLFGGQVPLSNALFRVIILALLGFGCSLHPKIELTQIPIVTWLFCVGFLTLDLLHLVSQDGVTLRDVVMSYDDYYLLLLAGPAALAFRNTIRERAIARWTIVLLFVCAAIGMAQYWTQKPLLRTESVDGKFEIYSSSIFDYERAFSLFTSGLSYGLFAALCGALGVALCRTRRLAGLSLVLVSGMACFSTLTRNCYLVFACACVASFIFTFGKKPSRGRWLPILFFLLAILTILSGARSFGTEQSNTLKDAGSLLQRLDNWGYYLSSFLESSWINKLFGLGMTFNDDSKRPIDNIPLALILHIGLVGLTAFSVLLAKMWLYLRREALVTQQPFIIAAASLWTTLMCAGMFNIVLIQMGTVFMIAILCSKESPNIMAPEM